VFHHRLLSVVGFVGPPGGKSRPKVLIHTEYLCKADAKTHKQIAHGHTMRHDITLKTGIHAAFTIRARPLQLSISLYGMLLRYDEALKETFSGQMNVSFSIIQEFQNLATLHVSVLYSYQGISGRCDGVRTEKAMLA
jgi:hypothetical protein